MIKDDVQLEGCISELNFGYNAKMEGYTNSSSDILKLYEMLIPLEVVLGTQKIDEGIEA
jgi:hypothetical protein